MPISQKDVELKLSCYLTFYNLENLNNDWPSSYANEPEIIQLVKRKQSDLIELLQEYLNKVKNKDETILSEEEITEIKTFADLIIQIKSIDTSEEDLDIFPVLKQTRDHLEELTDFKYIIEVDDTDGFLYIIDEALAIWHDDPVYRKMREESREEMIVGFIEYFLDGDFINIRNSINKQTLAQDTYKRRTEAISELEEIFNKTDFYIECEKELNAELFKECGNDIDLFRKRLENEYDDLQEGYEWVCNFISTQLIKLLDLKI